MALSSELIAEFVKATNDATKTKKEMTYSGECVEKDGVKYVQLDGAFDGVDENGKKIPRLTPVTATVAMNHGDRVMVTIKNHVAYVTGNLTSPAPRGEVAIDVENKITELGYLVASKANVDQLNAERGRIDILQADVGSFDKKLVAAEARIGDLEADNVDIKGRIQANAGEIQKLNTDKLDAKVAEMTYAKAKDLEATNLQVHNLEGTYGEFEDLATRKFEALEGDIDDLNTKKLSATDADLKYANIDFSNIGKAAIEYFYATSGLIKDVVVDNGTITGHLIGVTISGDLIEGNTIKAEKLVIKGSDGLYYKLNTDGMKTEAEQTDQNSLNGSIIKAKSITASKISVTDLVAFGATIGGINISEGSIYSGAKDSVNNTTEGVYMDENGQIAIGDTNNYIKYYIDESGNRILVISADSILLGSDRRSIEVTVDDVESVATDAQQRVSETEALIEVLSESISMLVTDGNGASLMKQTENGWTFSTGDIQDLVNRTSENLNNLTNEVGDVSGTVGILQQAVSDLGTLADYVKIKAYEDEPCIELGEADSEFKLRITNTRMIFTEGSTVLAYFNNQSFHVNKAVVEEELQQGGFVWKVRSNGNLGLVWKGVSS